MSNVHLLDACQCIHMENNLPPELHAAERVSERHFSVRFHDLHYNVYLNGVRVAHPVECLTGALGWVVSFIADDDGRYYRCPASATTHTAICKRLLRGNVTVEAVKGRA